MNLSKEKLTGILDFDFGEVEIFDSVDSTNSYIKRNIASLPLWSLICSLSQTGGRGRMGRSFLSPEGGIYFSVLMPVGADNCDPAVITACAGVCVSDAVCRLTGLEPKIKWVNDVLIDDKKICGILCEGVANDENRISSIVCGVGINLIEPENGFRPEIADKAGAISQFCVPPEPEKLIAEIVNGLHSFSPDYSAHRFIERYRELSAVAGKKITLIRCGCETDVFVSAINDDASLEVEYPDGRRETVRSGEVSIKYQRRMT